MLISFDLFAQELTLKSDARQEVCLNGLWDFKSEVATEWTQIKVPGNYAYLRSGKWHKHYWDIFQYPKQWTGSGAVYKRSITVPENMQGKYIKLYVGGCHYFYEVYLNGIKIGEATDGYFPYEFLLNPALKAGTNELEISVSGDKHYTYGGESNAARGIWQDVYLKAYNHLKVESSFFVKTLVNDQKIVCDIPITNLSKEDHSFRIRNIVVDQAGNEVLDFGLEQWQSLKAGQEKVFSLEAKWENPHLWFPHDPYLYHIKTIITDRTGATIDEKITRFGFREVTWKGPHLYINNREIFLRGHGGHYLGDLQGTKEYARQWFRSLKAHGVNFMRLHIYPKHRELYEMADEEGFLLEAEPAFHFYVPEDTTLAKDHLGKLILNQRNHPSIIVWSVSNELRWRSGGEKPFLLKHARSIDDTRPVFSSDFSAYSTGGDILGHHYDWEVVWEDWEKYGPNKPMIWDEVASVWQPARPMDNYTAGYEITAQDYATGLGYDGRIQMQRNLDFVKDGRIINGKLHRINGLIPWDFSYNFFRWQPIGNHQGISPKWETLRGPGIKATNIKSNASTLNIWDEVLPIFEPNPGYYLFKDYMQFVRFWDTDKRNTFTSGETFTKTAQLFYEDTRLANEIRLKIETLDGQVLWQKEVPFEIIPGELKEDVSFTFKVPEVEKSTKVKVIRQFYYQGEAGYEHSISATIFPKPNPHLANIAKDASIAFYGNIPKLSSFLESNGVKVQQLHKLAALKKRKPDVLVLENFEHLKGGKHLSKYLNGGGKVISLHQPDEKSRASKYADASKYAIDADLVYTQIPKHLEGATYIMPAQTDFDFDLPEGKEMDFLTLDVNVPVSIYIGYDWEAFRTVPWIEKTFKNTETYLYTNDPKTYFRLYQKDFAAGTIQLGKNNSWTKPKQMYSVVIVPQNESDREKLAVRITNVASGKAYQVVRSGLKYTKPAAEPTITHLLNGAKHKVLSGLSQEDFAFTKATSQIIPLEKPTQALNYRTLLAGDKHGETMALYEMPIGKGNVLSSAIYFPEVLDEAPYPYLLANIINYQLNYQAENNSKAGLMAGTLWKQKLDALAVQYDDILSTNTYNHLQTIIVDFTDKKVKQVLQDRKQALSRFIENGGKLLVLDVEADGLHILNEITGKTLQLTEPFLEETQHCVKAAITWTRRDSPKEMVQYYDSIMVPAPFEWNYDPLLAGMANSDLYWDDQSMLDHGIIIQDMDPVFAAKDYNILLSNWKIDWARPKYGGEYTHLAKDERRANWFVNRDPVLLEINKGKGQVLLSTLKFGTGGLKGNRILAQLLTNLSVPIGGKNQFAASAKTFDLSDQRAQQKRFANLYYDQPQRRTGDVFDNRYSSQSNEKPDILLIGDPYAGAYFDKTTALLAKFGKTDKLVYEGSSKDLLDSLNRKGTEYFKKYELIYFVTGWGDLQKVENQVQSNISDFEKNLKAILAFFRKNSVKLYWGTILPLPKGQNSHEDQVAAYHQISNKLMVDSGVYVTDIGAFARTAFTDYLNGNKLELTDQEIDLLAKQVNAAIQFFGE